MASIIIPPVQAADQPQLQAQPVGLAAPAPAGLAAPGPAAVARAFFAAPVQNMQRDFPHIEEDACSAKNILTP